jgi:hypothetical protein
MHHNERANARTNGRAEAVVAYEPKILGKYYSHGYSGLSSSQTFFLLKWNGNLASLFPTDSKSNCGVSLRTRTMNLKMDKMDKMSNGSVANLLLYK